MILYFIMSLACISGFILFVKKRLGDWKTPVPAYKASVIIPARNEELNITHILGSLASQTYRPHEIIVVDDFSTDGTNRIASSYEGVRVIRNEELPPGWTGKTWAVWNGYRHSTGDLLIFLDADVRLSPRALETLVRNREKRGGAISVVPYHHTEKFYERFSLILYLLGIFAFTSPFEAKNPAKGMYGSCIVTTREDYERVNGHDSVRGELLDDLNLGRKFCQAGIGITNFIGCGHVSFRMYPYGIKGEVEGFGKGAVQSTGTLRPMTVALIAVWIAGLLASEFATPFLLAIGHRWAWPFLAGYIAYTVQIFYFLNYSGRYGIIMPVFHFMPSLFFVFVYLYSAYRVTFMGYVSWKGRNIDVKTRKPV